MNKLMGRGFILIVASFMLVTCTPLGQVFDNSDYDDFWTVPERSIYKVGENFNRNRDLRVFASSLGIVEPVPSTKVKINLITNPDSDNPDLIYMLDEKSTDNTYRLTDSNVGTGTKLVIVTYGGNTAEYWIEVLDPLGVGGGGGGNGNGDDGGSGLGIIWR